MSGAGLPAANTGFTLLEMVVVLSILGLATAIAAPSVLHSIGTWQRRGEVESVLDQIRGLPGSARAQGSDVLISPDALASPRSPLRAEAGSTVTTEKSWRVRHNGVCDGGVIAIESAGRTTRIAVAAPFCDPYILSD